MPALKDVKNKINGVTKTKQITKAMNMVASAKLRHAQSRIERFRPYADKFYEMLGELAKGADSSIHPLLEARAEVKTVLMVVITSDRGLCGAFNNNIINAALKVARVKAAEGKEVKIMCVGRKARDSFRRSSFEIVAAYVNEMAAFDFSLATRIGSEVIGGYVGGSYDEVIMAFGKFASLARQEPTLLPVLPLSPAEAGEEVKADGGAKAEYIYEPSVEGLLAELLPRFINVQIYRGLLDTSASEHAARMRSMDNATRNCDDLVSSLTLVYNKARQTAITKELMDIVGGSEALKG
ncbi:F0F1 ATP synthase subunit gamma [Desulfovibrio sp. TomC]|uniref:F0F1 ATP synthase subunit gamma n=1 Tax=Desulfovibrio sp. TomC TaxID=1562888 RepID=UPI000574F5D5|nr:F0F1 ATP synthase subunit gamma [Desulfovibrio sp. TomC]KHK02011.1 ATP synthase gamma chain [Desulfovibrio sp. TomC]